MQDYYLCLIMVPGAATGGQVGRENKSFLLNFQYKKIPRLEQISFNCGEETSGIMHLRGNQTCCATLLGKSS